MQLIKIFSLCHRSISIKYLNKTSCLSKYGHYNAKSKFLKNSILKIPRTSIIATSLSHLDHVHCLSRPLLTRYKHTDENPVKNLEDPKQITEEPTEKLSLFKRYKKMLKEYWYVLLPVHMVTSALWFGGFFYAATRGLDIVPFLEYINLPEQFIKPLRSSSLGHIAVASALYKLATPARYMVTIGGTTFSVKFLTKRGLIRPVPTKAEIKTIIQNKLKKESPSEKDK